MRQRLNEILGIEERTDEHRTELRTLTSQAQDLEIEIRAALVSAPDPVDEPAGEGDREAREREELRSAFNVGAVLAGVFGSGRVEGREAEYQAAAGVERNQIPLDVWERRDQGADLETRAITPAPTNVGRNIQVPVPALFDQSVAPFLGVTMPAAGVGDYAVPVLSTSVTGGVVAKGAAAAETAGAFTVTSAQPRRLTGSFRLAVEDAARLRNMDAALRMNLRSVLTDALDDQIVNGSGSGDGTVSGLLSQLTDPTADSNVSGNTAYAVFLQSLGDLIDGKHATDETGVAALVGLDTYRLAVRTVSSDRSRSAATVLRQDFGGFRASARLGGVKSKKQAAIGVRMRRGVPNAAMPTWGSMTIDDPYTGAGKGQRVVTAYVLCGDVILQRADGYEQLSYQVKA